MKQMCEYKREIHVSKPKIVTRDIKYWNVLKAPKCADMNAMLQIVLERPRA